MLSERSESMIPWPEPAALPSDERSLGSFPLVAFAMAFGALLVALGFAAGRENGTWAAPIYWIGIITVFIAPTSVLVGRRRVSYVEGLALTLSLAITTFVIKECYSPLQFTFSDEFLHQSTLQTILNTHHLFHQNSQLPASPFYPALEIITGTMSLTSHLSIQASSIVILCVVHTLGTVALYFLGFEITKNTRVSALAVVIYATGGDYLFFDSYFSYQSIGVPLAIITLLSFIRMTRSTSRPDSIFWTTSTVVFGITTVISHHVSSYMMVLLMVCLILAELYSPTRLYARTDVLLALAAIAVMTVFWDTAIARPTVSYLTTAFLQLLGHNSAQSATVNLPNGAGHNVAIAHTAVHGIPFRDTLFEYIWVLLISFSLALGLIAVFKKRRSTTPQLISWALASTSVVIALGFRFVSPSGGGELSSRLLSFTLIPGSLICAIGVTSLSRYWLHSRSAISRLGSIGRMRWLLLLAFIAILEPGGIASGWPPYYARLPGPYEVAGRNRTVNSYDVGAARWASSHLPRGAVIASDLTDSELMDSIGGLSASNSEYVAVAFINSSVDGQLQRELSSLDLDFVVVNDQIASGVPVYGNGVFENDPFIGQYTAPIATRALAKFGDLPGVSKIYVGGPVKIYDVRGSRYGRS